LVSDDQRSGPGEPVSAGRSRRSGRHGVFRATLVYLGVVYVWWVCYYTVEDLRAGEFSLGPLGFAQVTTLAALILIGIPTIIGTVIALLLCWRLGPVWYTLISVLAVFGPSLCWFVQPAVDRKSVILQQVAQALFLVYLLLPLRHPDTRSPGSDKAT
jgi:hypothetical protein